MLKETLKEMGKVCQNRKVCEEFRDFHRQRFMEMTGLNWEQADAHRNRFLFWTDKIALMNEHIQQLHERIQGVA